MLALTPGYSQLLVSFAFERSAPQLTLRMTARQSTMHISLIVSGDFARWLALISSDREEIFRTIMSGCFDRHGYWFRRLGRRQEFDCGRFAFACFLP
jgi:hypothetical protein